MGKLFAILSGPILFLLPMLLNGIDPLQTKMLGVALWMLAWWITNCLPIGVTALLPIVLFPLLDIMPLKKTTANYAHPVIYLFFGGFVLGLAIEKWNLHKRIALSILKLSGDNPSKIVFGAMLATSILSMWISNTATTVMMLPIGMSIIQLLGKKIASEQNKRNFALSVLLGIAYAANIGGIATLIGTPPNLVLSSILNEQNIYDLSFSSWMLFAFPLAAILFFIAYFINHKLIYRVREEKISGIGELIQDELNKIGSISHGEKRVLLVLLSIALLWIIRAPISKLEGLSNLSDPIIAILAVFLLFIIPSEKGKASLLVWEDTKKLPWGILLLFGGGLSLAKGLEISNIVTLIGDWIAQHTLSVPLIVVFTVTLFALFLTEIMSNVALVAVFIPVAIVVANSFGINELQLSIPLTIAASCAFMFPISTPPNAVVYSSGFIKMKDMSKAGILLNLLCVLVIVLYSYYAIPLIF